MESSSSTSLISQGWNISGKQRLFWIGIVILQLLVSFVLGKFFGEKGLVEMPILYMLLSLVTGSIFMVAITRMSLRAIKGEALVFDDLFADINIVPRLILGNIIYTVVVVIGLILLVVPGIFMAIHWGYFRYAMVEKNMGIMESFTESARITAGNKWRLIGFAILLLLVNIAGAILIGIGLLWTIPTTYVAGALMYKVMEKEKGHSTKTEVAAA